MITRKVYENPIIGDKVVFVKTSAETGGQCTLLELDLVAHGQGTPAHYHDGFTETFTVLEGQLQVAIGKEVKTLKKGESATVPLNTIHRFYNGTAQPVKAHIELRPGHTGFENSVKIAYGLACDGQCNDKSIPKNIAHLALLFDMSDGRIPGIASMMMPVFRFIAKRARKKGIEKELVEKYCQ